MTWKKQVEKAQSPQEVWDALPETVQHWANIYYEQVIKRPVAAAQSLGTTSGRLPFPILHYIDHEYVMLGVCALLRLGHPELSFSIIKGDWAWKTIGQKANGIDSEISLFSRLRECSFCTKLAIFSTLWLVSFGLTLIVIRSFK